MDVLSLEARASKHENTVLICNNWYNIYHTTYSMLGLKNIIIRGGINATPNDSSNLWTLVQRIRQKNSPKLWYRLGLIYIFELNFYFCLNSRQRKILLWSYLAGNDKSISFNNEVPSLTQNFYKWWSSRP